MTDEKQEEKENLDLQAALDEALYQACAEGTVEEVRALLARGANPNTPHWEVPWYDEDGDMRENYYCIHEAALNPDLGVLEALVEAGADPNQVNYWGQQALANAVCHNTLEAVRRLVKLGNDPNRCDDDGGSVLSWAALNPDIRVVEFLLERGAELDNTAWDETELCLALKDGTPERVRFFLEHGSDMSKVRAETLADAPWDNLRVLLEHGYDPDPTVSGAMCPKDTRLLDILDPERRALFEEFAERRKKEEGTQK
jgi:ankyrin repeat protein